MSVVNDLRKAVNNINKYKIILTGGWFLACICNGLFKECNDVIIKK